MVSRAMVRDLFPPADLRRIFSMLVLVLGVSPLISPFIGGYLLVWFGWKSIFSRRRRSAPSRCLRCISGWMNRCAPEHVRPLHMDHIMSSYTHLLRDRTFLGASLVCGFSSAGMFAYIASAPFVFINMYKLPPQQFGWLFGVIAAGLIGASQVNGRMSHRIALWQVLRVANSFNCSPVSRYSRPRRPASAAWPDLCAGLRLYVRDRLCVSERQCHRHDAPRQHGRHRSALLGTNQFVIAAATTIVLGLIDNSSAMPMAIVIAACGTAATLLNFTLVLASRAADWR